MDAAELEGDTLDPQTGLFYRSNQSELDPIKQTALPAAVPQHAPSRSEAEPSLHSSTPTPQAPPTPPQPQSKPQPSPSSSTPPLTKKILRPRDQTPPRPQTLTQSPKDRPPTAPAQAAIKVTPPGATTKPPVTPQLPKLQHAPTSLHRPLHMPMSHPPPLQAHHPISTEKTASSQVSLAPPLETAERNTWVSSQVLFQIVLMQSGGNPLSKHNKSFSCLP